MTVINSEDSSDCARKRQLCISKKGSNQKEGMKHKEEWNIVSKDTTNLGKQDLWRAVPGGVLRATC